MFWRCVLPLYYRSICHSFIYVGIYSIEIQTLLHFNMLFFFIDPFRHVHKLWCLISSLPLGIHSRTLIVAMVFAWFQLYTNIWTLVRFASAPSMAAGIVWYLAKASATFQRKPTAVSELLTPGVARLPPIPHLVPASGAASPNYPKGPLYGHDLRPTNNLSVIYREKGGYYINVLCISVGSSLGNLDLVYQYYNPSVVFNLMRERPPPVIGVYFLYERW